MNTQAAVKQGKDVWGPPLWYYFHVLCIHQTGWHRFEQFVTCLKRFMEDLDCPECKTHFCGLIDRNPPMDAMLALSDVNMKARMAIWSYQIHALATYEIKKSNTFTLADFAEKYKMHLAAEGTYDMIVQFIREQQGVHG